MPRDAPPALLLVGHGARDRRGLEEFRQVVRSVASRMPERAVEGCFLELAPPDIAAGIAVLAARGERRVVVQPLLLFAAGHSKRDIPQAVREAAANHAGMEFRMGAPLACRQELLQLSTTRYREALGGRAAVPADAMLLMLVGRGSLDPEANAEMSRFSRLRWEHTPVGRLETCFLAMTRPALDESLAIAADLPYRQVVVQPHLLFQGELVDSVRQAVKAMAAIRPEKEWVVTRHLGPHELLAEAIVRRAESAVSDIMT